MEKAYDYTAAAGKTAVARTGPSVPARWLVENHSPNSVFDWGCGRGTDAMYFAREGLICHAWDPIYFPRPEPEEYKYTKNERYEWVTLTYVLNVLPRKLRQRELLRIFSFMNVGERILVTVRTKRELMRNWNKDWHRLGDMFVTKSGTCQRGFEDYELAAMMISSYFIDPVVVMRKPLMIVASKKIDVDIVLEPLERKVRNVGDRKGLS